MINQKIQKVAMAAKEKNLVLCCEDPNRFTPAHEESIWAIYPKGWNQEPLTEIGTLEETEKQLAAL